MNATFSPSLTETRVIRAVGPYNRAPLIGITAQNRMVPSKVKEAVDSLVENGMAVVVDGRFVELTNLGRAFYQDLEHQELGTAQERHSVSTPDEAEIDRGIDRALARLSE